MTLPPEAGRKAALAGRAFAAARASDDAAARLDSFLRLYGFCRNFAFVALTAAVAFISAALIYAGQRASYETVARFWWLAAGASFGLGFSPVVARTVARTPAFLAGEASALVSTTAQLGFTVGVASLGAIYLNAAASTLTSATAFEHVTFAAGLLACFAAAVTRPDHCAVAEVAARAEPSGSDTASGVT